MSHVIALKRDYDEKIDGFRDHYTGVVLDETNTKSPRYLTYDHLIPGLKTVDNQVVTMAIINEIKTDLTWEEFVAIARQVVAHEDGAVFDERVLDVKHWLRFVNPRMANRPKKR